MGKRRNPNVNVTIPRNGMDLFGFLKTVEINLIRQAMERAQGVKKAAASLLGLNRTTLVEKIKRHELAEFYFKPGPTEALAPEPAVNDCDVTNTSGTNGH